MDAIVPFKKVYFLNYVGSITFHRFYAKSMVPWLISKVIISNKSLPIYCSLNLDHDGIFVKKEEMNLIDLNSCKSRAASDSNSVSSLSNSSCDESSLSSTNDDQIAKASLDQLIEGASLKVLGKTYFYIVLNSGDETYFTLFLFHHTDSGLINEVGGDLKKFLQWYEKQTKLSGLPSKNVKLEDLDSIRFEVMLLGKLQINSDMTSQPNFIDDAVKKYHSLEMEHAAEMEEFKLIKSLSKDVTELSIVDTSSQPESNYSSFIDGSRLSAKELIKLRQNNSYNRTTNRRPSFDETRQQRHCGVDNDVTNPVRPRVNRTRHCSEPSAAATLGFDKNKTRIFQVGKRCITVISPDQSARALEIPFNLVGRCSKGVKSSDHFGVFVHDTANRVAPHPNQKSKEGQKFKCYLFRCSDVSLCDEILHAVKQSCSVCGHKPDPMTSFHTLCKRANSTSGNDRPEQKLEKGLNLTANCIVNLLSDAEQKRVRLLIDDICTEHPPESKTERLVIVMDAIRVAFEERQLEYDLKLKQMRDRDGQGHSAVSKRLTFIKSRAKKSLSSIESIWGKGIQMMQDLHHEAESHMQSPVDKFRFFTDNARSAPNTPAPHHQPRPMGASRVRHHSESPAYLHDEVSLMDPNLVAAEVQRPRSNTLGSPSQGSINVRRKLNMSGTSLDRDDLGNSEAAGGDSKSRAQATPPPSLSSSPGSIITPDRSVTCSGRKLSERQKIFIRVATPKSHFKNGHALPRHQQVALESPLKTPEQVRQAWRRAIRDQITLNKIEKLSAVAEAEERMADPLRCKVDAERNDDCPPGMSAVWEELLDTDQRARYKVDSHVLHAAVRRGVPTRLRSKVWSLLFEQWKLRQKPDNQSAFRLPETSYKSLLKQLTSHQHAILIDLGRTFPSHTYFNQQLSDGQLGLFNVLKAYALVDQDVGYCQGLNFVAGFLLLHTPTAQEAFSMLCHLMADMNFRRMYLPEMEVIQIAVYQMSRLLYDFHRDLHDHFENNDVDLTMFVTPWFLTMFASVLSLTFTARIFDLIFLEGRAALFKAALCLLGFHKKNLLDQECFESIVGYLKDTLPKMKSEETGHVLNKLFGLDIEDLLLVYQAEFTVFQDEGLPDSGRYSDTESIAHELEAKYNRLQQAHQSVTKYNLDLLEKLEAAQMQINSLQQGLTDMAVINENHTLQLEQLKQENEELKLR